MIERTEKSLHQMNGLQAGDLDRVLDQASDEEPVLIPKAPATVDDLHERLSRVESVLKSDLSHQRADLVESSRELLKHLKDIGLDNVHTQILHAALDRWDETK